LIEKERITQIGEQCPYCKGTGGSYVINFNCPKCDTILPVNQNQIHKELGANLICHICQNIIKIPSTVWCPLCKQNFKGDTLKIVREYNEHIKKYKEK
jgi:uncharacterized protein YbaR (Trm112 family)